MYVTDEPDTSWVKAVDGTKDIPADAYSDLLAFRKALLEGRSGNLSRIDWGPEGCRERLRIKRVTSSYYDPLFVVRRFREPPSSLRGLGFPPGIVKRLLEVPIEPGLVIFMGEQESGKTTSANAFLKEYVGRTGALAFTVECPAEIDIEGRYGDGRIIQTEVEDESELGDALRGLLRTGANVFFCGEVTRDNAAREVQAIATAGHIMVTTFHSGDLLSGLRRFGDAAGGNYAALADALSAVFYLEMGPERTPLAIMGEAPGRPAQAQKPLRVSPLVVTRATREMIKSNLRGGTFQQLAGEMERQLMMYVRGEIPR